MSSALKWSPIPVPTYVCYFANSLQVYYSFYLVICLQHNSNTTAWMVIIFREHHNSYKVKVGVLRPVQQPGSYWDRSSVLLLVEG